MPSPPRGQPAPRPRRSAAGWPPTSGAGRRRWSRSRRRGRGLQRVERRLGVDRAVRRARPRGGGCSARQPPIRAHHSASRAGSGASAARRSCSASSACRASPTTGMCAVDVLADLRRRRRRCARPSRAARTRRARRSRGRRSARRRRRSGRPRPSPSSPRGVPCMPSIPSQRGSEAGNAPSAISVVVTGSVGDAARARVSSAARLGVHDAAAGVEHRPPRRRDRLRGRCAAGARCGTSARAVAGQRRRVAAPSRAGARARSAGTSTSDRPGPPGARDVERLVDRLGDVVGPLDRDRVLDDRLRHADHVAPPGRRSCRAGRLRTWPVMNTRRDRVHVRVGDRR